jgi:hypothetical protein
MDWNAKLDWAEEVTAMLVILPVPVIGVAVLWYLAPSLYRRRMAAQKAAQEPMDDAVVAPISGKTAAERT